MTSLWVGAILALWIHQVGATKPPEMTEAEAVALAEKTLREQRLPPEKSVVCQRAEAVVWPDARLGCAEESGTFAPVATPGFRVLFRAGPVLYRVHVGNGKAIVCGDGLRLGPTEPQIDEEAMTQDNPKSVPESPETTKMVHQAKEDLAKRISVEPERIDLVEFESVVWPDTSLGCPQPGMEYLQVPRDGARIRLRFGKRTYEYHSGGTRGPFLCKEELSESSH